MPRPKANASQPAVGTAPMDAFHEAVRGWFAQRFHAPTEVQLRAWAAIRAGRHTLVAAPTGSGKTLSAFLVVLDELVRQAQSAPLPDEVAVVYVSPLKALSNDIHLNLEAPLAGISERLRQLGLPNAGIRIAVRTGDTPQSERNAFRRRPPHVLVTTPESLYLLLGAASGRQALASTRTVIVDEIHALAASKRGSHLALSLERLEALCGRHLLRVGLSATQKPIDDIARFLVGARQVGPDGAPDCAIVDAGYHRQRDIGVVVGPQPLQAVMSQEQWQWVYDHVAELTASHRTILVFTNTRRMAERAARHLAERLGKQQVAAHHGSMAHALRQDAEQRLKNGALRVLVATASLELGIDIGEVDLVCQLGSPRSIATFLQRVGRARHHVGGVPKGLLFPQSRDDLFECAALLRCVHRQELDAVIQPEAPLDVLAQHMVAETASVEWDEDALYRLVRGAWPYARLAERDYQEVVAMLSDGVATQRGTRGAYLHRDRVHGRLRGRRGSRLVALTSGGAIPDTADYAVVLQPAGHTVGSVHEDFAVESLAGDVFQLGNTSYRVLRVEAGCVRVEDAQGAPPSIPFWLGEAPGRSRELSQAVSALRADLDAQLACGSPEEGLRHAVEWLRAEVRLSAEAAQALAEYAAHMKAAFGFLPTQECLALERFFDESGGMQLLIHSPYGSRLNRAWGLALRKRFCRKFNFELQAAATEDAILLSLSTSHSFPLEEVVRYLHSSTAEGVLVQALLDAPLFGVRWRWNSSVALALPRFSGGKKVAPQLQRMRGEDLLAAVFPDQVACAENIVGEREVPDHPLVRQTLHDCLYEAMDTEGWLRLLRGIESGAVRVVARDLTAPSPFAAEALHARPYAFLDDAPLEERRTQAVISRRYGELRDTQDLGRLDPDAIEAVRLEAWPEVRDGDEMHQALLQLGCVTQEQARAHPGWEARLGELARDGRAACLQPGSAPAPPLWFAAERAVLAQHLFPDRRWVPVFERVPPWSVAVADAQDAARELLRSQLSGLGPVSAGALADGLGLSVESVAGALLALEGEGYVMRGRFIPGVTDEQWCERHLLARIHRYTVHRLRREIEPVEPRDWMRFLCDWQRVTPETRMRGPEALAEVIDQLQGYAATAEALEKHLLPARLVDYRPSSLDELCASGRVTWLRLQPARQAPAHTVRATPIALLPRHALPYWLALRREQETDDALSSRAQAALGCLRARGALFFDELAAAARLLHAELEDALSELVAKGCVHSDRFAGLRALMLPAHKKPSQRRTRHGGRAPLEAAGRWSLVGHTPLQPSAQEEAQDTECIARALLRRYGVVFWRLLEREADHLPPWRSLLRAYHRLEARGEVRGGRFVAGMSGEQFALPEAVGLLRQVRRRPPGGDWLKLSAADPLNVLGTVLAGKKLPRAPGVFFVLRDGVPVASVQGSDIEYLTSLDAAETEQVQRLFRPGGTLAVQPVPV